MAQDNTNPKWEDNSIQFPRLIAEAEAAGIWSDACDMHGAGTSALEDMAASMDLDVSEVFELISRAQKEWEQAVVKHCPINSDNKLPHHA